MKLMRLGAVGEEKPAVLMNGVRYYLPGFPGDFNEVFFATDGLMGLQRYLHNERLNLVEVPPHVRIGCPIARPSKIVFTACVQNLYNCNFKTRPF
jgi:2,4-diketo-3-deoxy-L-fuconate hydrolase